MGVQAVDFNDGRGPVPIDESNAKQALERRKELDLSVSQIKYAKSFLSNDELEYIFQSENESRERGEESIGDKEKADAHDGQGGNAAATSVGMAAGAAGLVATVNIAMTSVCTSGWVGLGFGTLTLAESAVCLASAKMFDNAYDDRKECRDNGDATNETIDGYTSQLEDSMDSMNDDLEEYQGAINSYTASKNDNTNRQADVQMQMQDAEAMGDVKKVAALKEELKGLGETDFSKQEEEMGEIKDRLDEYDVLADEAGGAGDAATTVADFLKEGLPLGIVASIDAVLLAIATGYCGVAMAGCTVGSVSSAAHLDFAGSASGIVGMALFAIAMGLTGTAGGIMVTKAKNEFECHSKGGDMQNHVNTMNEMLVEQTAYVEQSNENFDKADEESEKNQEEAAEKAGEATSSHGEGYKAGSTSGAGESGSSGSSSGGSGGGGSGGGSGSA